MPSYPSPSSSSSSSAGGGGRSVGAGSVAGSSLVFRVGLNGSIPDLVRQVLLERGWTEFDERQNRPDDWNILWSSSGFRLCDYAFLLPWQRLNHHPQSTFITHKDKLARAMKCMNAIHGPTVYNFSPFAFLLPTDYRRLVAELQSSSSSASSSAAGLCGQQHRRSGTVAAAARQRRRRRRLWIFKPVDESRGRGICIFSDLNQLQQHIDRSKPGVVQEYIANPLLISRYKFDLRLYVFVACFHPLRVYLHENGLARFSTEKFDLESLDNTYSHLTNTSINRFGLNYGSDKERVGTGCKWTLDQLRQYFYQSGIDDMPLWSQIINIVILTVVLQTQQQLQASIVLRGTTTCFELYGFDVLIDDQLKPWLLEVNFSPSLSCDCNTDNVVKRPMLNDLFQLIESDLSQTLRRNCRQYQTNGLQPSCSTSVDEIQRSNREWPMPISQRQHLPLIRGNQQPTTKPDPSICSILYRGTGSIVNQDVATQCHNGTCHSHHCRHDVCNRHDVVSVPRHDSIQCHDETSEQTTSSSLNSRVDDFMKTVPGRSRTRELVHRNSARVTGFPLHLEGELRGRTTATKKSLKKRFSLNTCRSVPDEDEDKLEDDEGSHLERRRRRGPNAKVSTPTRTYESSRPIGPTTVGRFVQVFPFNAATRLLSSTASANIDIRKVAAESRKIMVARNALTSIASAASAAAAGCSKTDGDKSPSSRRPFLRELHLRQSSSRTSEGVEGIPQLWMPLQSTSLLSLNYISRMLSNVVENLT